MFLQNSNDVMMPLEVNLQLASPLFAQSPITLQRKLGDRMNSNEWLFQYPKLSGINAELLNRNLWQQFYEQNTEMIITKSGRRMFPSVQINVSGLQKRKNYYVLMEIAPASDRRHKYCGYESGNKSGGNMGGWSFAGPAEPQHPFNRRIYMHPDSPAMGNHWMDNSISFNKLKLTNNINDTKNTVLTSMHKYVPKIWIIECPNAPKSYEELFSYPTTSFAFKETEFIAVTAYQNENITKLKIDNNPFAKGFRETGQSRHKRKYHIDHQVQSDSSRDEGVSFSDSESNQIASERGSVASNLEDPTQEPVKRLAVESNTDNDARDNVRPIAANPRSPVKVENEVPLHRPWLDPPRSQVTPSPSSYNPYYLHHLYYHRMYSQYMTSQAYMNLHDYHFRNYHYQSPWWP